MAKESIQIQVNTKNNQESEQITNALQTLANNITPDNLRILAKKSEKLGINKKIKQYQHFL